MAITEEIKYAQLAKTTDNDEKKENFLNLINNENLRANVIASMQSDDLKLKYIPSLTNDSFKNTVIITMHDKEKIFSSLAFIKDGNILNNLIIFAFDNKELQDKARKTYVPGYLSMLNEFKNQSFTDEIYSLMEPTIEEEIKLGTEIEVTGDNAKLVYSTPLINGWETQKEDSLNKGVEITSPPFHYTKESMMEVIAICNYIDKNNLEATLECGGHIHIDSKIIREPKAFSLLLYIYKNCERIIYLITNKAYQLPRPQIIRFARTFSPIIENLEEKHQTKLQNSFYKGSLNIETTDELNNIIEEIQTMQKGRITSRYQTQRDYGMNTLNLNHSKDTIEYRMANGTKDPQELFLNFTLFASLFSTCKRLANKELTNEEIKLLNNIANEDELTRFNAFLNLLFTNPKLKEKYKERYIANQTLANQTDSSLSYLQFANTKRGI